MKYLIDMDWVVDYLNDRPVAISLLRSLADDGIALCDRHSSSHQFRAAVFNVDRIMLCSLVPASATEGW